jgi:hypothetical protein
MARRDGRPAANRDAKGVRCISLASRDVAGREELFVNHPKVDGVVGYEAWGRAAGRA